MDISKDNMLHPDYFYDHGRNPAYKELVYLMAANSSTKSGIRRYQTIYYAETGPRRYLMFKNMEQLFKNTLLANTVPKTLTVYASISIACHLAIRHARGFVPLGKYGVTDYRKLNSFKYYGLAGVVLPIAAMALSAFIWYRATVYTGNFVINNVFYGDRDYLNLYTMYNNEFGNYNYSDHVLMNKPTGRKLGAAIAEVEKVKEELINEERDRFLKLLEDVEQK